MPAPPPADTARFRRRPALCRTVTGGLLVATPRPGHEPLFLSDPGPAVWLLLDTPRRVDEICELLAARYEVGADVIAADVVTLIDELVTVGLVGALVP